MFHPIAIARPQDSFGSNMMTNTPLLDFYRCPESALDIAAFGTLSRDEGYFRFGAAATCYGRSSAGIRNPRAQSDLYDVERDVIIDEGQVRLPFDLEEVVNNLRLERYAHGGLTDSPKFLRRLYYSFRPSMNLAVRAKIQKLYSRNWQKRVFPKWPVDTTVEDIFEKLLLLSMEASGVDEIPFVWFWPDGARGCVLLTHDVETQAGLDFCNDLMDLDDSFGMKAAFQVVPEGRYAIPADFVNEMHCRGFEFGIQDLNHDGKLYDDPEEFLRRAGKINAYASRYGANAFRAAVLYRRPGWLRELHLSIDMSIPNVAHLDPQRGGCCTVMPFFIGDTLELPVTTAQDYALFYLLNDRSINLWNEQLDLILQKNGLASFIVHPDYITDSKNRSVYVSLLEHLRVLRGEGHLWSALPKEIDSWWRSRSRMVVIGSSGSWQIVGEGSERAVLAFAKRVSGRLVYEVADGGHYKPRLGGSTMQNGGLNDTV